MKSVVVPKKEGQDAVERLKECGALRRDRRIAERGDALMIPVVGTLAEKAGFAVKDIEDTPERAVAETPYRRIAKVANIPERLKGSLPARWELLGDVVVLDLPPELEPYAEEAARAYAEVLGARSVVDVSGTIRGELRLPRARLLLGYSSETTHVENGIRYTLDPCKVMFSSGNIDERIRMGRIPMVGETAVDMFAGIGYFTLPMAKHGGAKVTAYEKNPVAHGYLERNIADNGLEGRVEARLGDNRDAEEGVADRVVMGYMGGTHAFLDKAVRLLKGDGTIHYHDGFYEKELWHVPTARIDEAVAKAGGSWTLAGRRIVKSYARRRYHVVMDILYSPGGTLSPEPERVRSS